MASLEQSLVASSTDPSKKADTVDRLLKARRKAHLNTIQNFTDNSNNCHDALEKVIFKACNEFKDAVQEVDARLSLCFDTIRDNTFVIECYEGVNSFDQPSASVDTLQTNDSDEGRFATLPKSIPTLHQTLLSLTSERHRIIQSLESLLLDIECQRRDSIHTLITDCTNELISIAYYLPNEVEKKIVEKEVYAINSVLIGNVKAHSRVVRVLRKGQAEVDVQLSHNWEIFLQTWRQLKHDQALNRFRALLSSERFMQPAHRTSILASYEEYLTSSDAHRNDLLKKILSCTVLNISSKDIQDTMSIMSGITDVDVSTAQMTCQRLSQSNEALHREMKDEVEELRFVLHFYSALSPKPCLSPLASALSRMVEDPCMADLLRSGGSLKADIEACASLLSSRDIMYDAQLEHTRRQMSCIAGCFGLKSLLESKGRTTQLDRMRSLVLKLRSTRRGAAGEVVRALLPDVKELARMDGLCSEVVAVLEAMARDMADRLLALSDLPATTPVGTSNPSSATSLGSSSSRQPTATPSQSTRLLHSPSKSRSVMSSSRSKLGLDDEEGGIDPYVTREWGKILGELLHSCDLPDQYKALCLSVLAAIHDQLHSNAIVDAVVVRESHVCITTTQLKLSSMVHSFGVYLEHCILHASNYYTNAFKYLLQLAMIIEQHKHQLSSLKEVTKDELWDISETHRIGLMDLEEEYRSKCLEISACPEVSSIQNYFDSAIATLDRIQAEYRTFHSKSCFAADKETLVISDEFCGFIEQIGHVYGLAPGTPNSVLEEYSRVLERTSQYNKHSMEAVATAVVSPGVHSVPSRKGHAEGSTDASADKKIPRKSQVKTDTETFVSKQGAFYSILRPIDAIVADFLLLTDSEYVESAVVKPHTAKTPHSAVRWLSEGAHVLTSVQETQLSEEERMLYMEHLAEHFIHMSDTELHALSVEMKAEYKALSANITAFHKSSSGSKLSMYTVPLDLFSKRPMIASNPINTETLLVDLSTLRDGILTYAETFSLAEIKTSTHVGEVLKAELTRQLEDRLRHHWPRKGKCETEIKTIRVAELQTHEERVFRFIQSAQKRFTDLKSRVEGEIRTAHGLCTSFEAKFKSSTASLSDGAQYTQLATLQAIDTNARRLMAEYVAHNADVNGKLARLINDDSTSILAYLDDYRRYHPSQAETESSGSSGGYSEEELKELSALVAGQTSEMRAMVDDMNASLSALKKVQDGSAALASDFSKQYESIVQAVSMAEGLGVVYGAPRRRAIERLRHIDSMDVLAATTLNDALCEFTRLCDACLHSSSSVPSLDALNNAWSSFAVLLNLLLSRATFLDVLVLPPLLTDATTCPWIAPSQTNDIAAKSKAAPPASSGGGKAKGKDNSTCFNGLVKNVDAECRKETLELINRGKAKGVAVEANVSSSLDAWLKGEVDKMARKNDESWLQLWRQLEVIDSVLLRFQFPPNSQISSNIDFPHTCFSSLKTYALSVLRTHVERNTATVARLLQESSLLKDKFSRQLRPSLRLPDMKEELARLEADARQLSAACRERLATDRSVALQFVVSQGMACIEQQCDVFRGLLSVLGCIGRVNLSVPPSLVGAPLPPPSAAEKTSPPMVVDPFLELCAGVEALIPDTPGAVLPAPVKGKPKAVGTVAVSATSALVPSQWIADMATRSTVKSIDSPSSVLLIRKRDEVLQGFSADLKSIVTEINSLYEDAILSETDWKRRWDRKIELLMQQQA